MFVTSAQTKLDATSVLVTQDPCNEGEHINHNGGYAEKREISQDAMERYEVQSFVTAMQARAANSNDELNVTFA